MACRLSRMSARFVAGAIAAAAVALAAGARAEGIVDMRVAARGASVYVDGVRRGSIPEIDEFRLQLRLPAGTRRIELRRTQNNPFYDMRSSHEVVVTDDAVTSATMPPLTPFALPGAAKRVSETVDALVRDLVTIPAGSFLMGSSDVGMVSESELPRHKVTIAHPFLLARTEVTFDQLDACVVDKGCTTVPDEGSWGRNQGPVVNVTWADTQEFAAWLSRVTGRRFRLPSEAEWEYAARGGTETAYFFGDDPADLPRYAWFNHERPQRVGLRRPNPFGLYDMLGNVGEWVEDCWHDNFQGAPTDGSAWLTGKCRVGVVKGGDWDDKAWYLRPAHRVGHMRRNRYDYIGFRVATQP